MKVSCELLSNAIVLEQSRCHSAQVAVLLLVGPFPKRQELWFTALLPGRNYAAPVLLSYQDRRTYLSLGKDAPQARRMQASADGMVIEIHEAGELHRHYGLSG
ncbi:MAG: hypothetical protein ABFD63_11645 [Smithella sp.]